MIKKMRDRMILSAMLAFFFVVMLIAVLVNVVNYGTITARLDNDISNIAGFKNGMVPMPDMGKNPAGPFKMNPDPESNYMMRFFVVRYDKSGNILSTSMDNVASVDSNEAETFGQKALSSRADRGYIGNYRYHKETKDDGTVIIFLNAGREQRDMNSLMLLTLIISLASLTLVFILVVILSRRAIKPFADNISRQKQFITDASHELKTPLTSINTSMDVITMEHGDDEWTDNIRKQTGRMSRLVADLVTLSRLDEVKPMPDREQFSLSNAAWEIVDVYSPQAKGASKYMKVDIEDDITMTGDKASIQQMMSVLLDNAIKYSDPNGEIRFSLFRKKGRIRLEVFNTCSYDKAPDTEKLFDRFYRPDESRNSDTGGTGVGLAIAKAVAETHGGSISASCPSGKTMTIKVIL